MNLHDLSFNTRWTLFLDRDGVINRRIIGDYVRHWDDFEFLDGALDALGHLGSIFGRIIVVSNQQGVGKGLMDAGQVAEIHEKMLQEVLRSGGRIDRVYFSPHLEDEKHPDRKPGPGMAYRAREEFPEIELERSVMVGDSRSDMQFGRNIGAVNILVTDPDQMEDIPEDLYDFRFPTLLAFTRKLKT